MIELRSRLFTCYNFFEDCFSRMCRFLPLSVAFDGGLLGSVPGFVHWLLILRLSDQQHCNDWTKRLLRLNVAHKVNRTLID